MRVRFAPAFRGDERIGGSAECQTPIAQMPTAKKACAGEPVEAQGKAAQSVVCRWRPFRGGEFFCGVFDSFASLLPPIRILQLAD
jgi:hypothetical protein